MPILTRAVILVVAASAILLQGCSTQAANPALTRSPAGTQAASDMQQLDDLYHQATAPHRRAARKPVRDQQDRALHLLAEHADRLSHEVGTWGGEARLTSDRPTAVDDLRKALADLKVAADARDMGATRTSYQMTLDSYRQLVRNMD